MTFGMGGLVLEEDFAGAGGGTNGWLVIIRDVGVFAGCIILAFLVTMLFHRWLLARLREAAGPAPIALPAHRTLEFVQGLHALGVALGAKKPRVPYTLGFFADEDGVKIRGTWVDSRTICQFRWQAVAGMSVAEVAQEGTRSRALVLDIAGEAGLVALPFVILGGALGGMLPLSWARLEVLSYKLNLLKAASVASGR
ncbi:MAG: hypothetical protein QOH55_1025 [Microbacteriaceae bacterium]|jgi:hypothetical protein|nr:hypothetical protein [Microbacteriaceae bacterium]